MPGVFSPEAGLIYVQGGLLVLRTLLSDYVSKLEGRAARWAIQSNGPLLSRTLGQFVAVGAGFYFHTLLLLAVAQCWGRDHAARPSAEWKGAYRVFDQAGVPPCHVVSTSQALLQGP